MLKFALARVQSAPPCLSALLLRSNVQHSEQSILRLITAAGIEDR